MMISIIHPAITSHIRCPNDSFNCTDRCNSALISLILIIFIPLFPKTPVAYTFLDSSKRVLYTFLISLTNY